MALEIYMKIGDVQGERSDPTKTISTATVQLGENNLSQVAQRLGIDLDSLLRANPQVSDPNKIQAGQEINVPQAAKPQAGVQDLQAISHEASTTSLPPAPLGDPLLKSVFQSKLGDILPQGDNVMMYADSGGVGSAAGAGSATGATAKGASAPVSAPQAAPTEIADVKSWLTNPEIHKNSVGKNDFAAAQKAIEAGDYTKAFEKLDTLIKTNGENLWDDEQKPTATVKDQLGFLSKIQKAGIKADYPPTEAQLVDFFKTLKDKPAAARQAFDDYAQGFHVHPVNIKGQDFEIKYSQEKHTLHRGGTDLDITTDAPRNWSDITSRPVSAKDFPEFIGKQMNDCKGFGLMADKLLGAAGFKVQQYVDTTGAHGEDHEMVLFTHEKENGFTLTSNDKTFQGNDQKELAKQGFKYGAGDHATGKEQFVTGKTAAEAEIQIVIKEHKL